MRKSSKKETIGAVHIISYVDVEMVIKTQPKTR